jgi:Epoxide hydrolase N terminus
MTKKFDNTLSPDRRQLLGAVAMSAVAAGVSGLLPSRPAAAAVDSAIRPFRVSVSEHDLVDLRRRLAATKWPDKETVDDQSQGVPLATLERLVRHWQNHDWRKVEARLNSLPQFVTRIDGVDIHFIHVRSKHENALPLIITHGWPGSIIEQLKVIDPLTNPTATRVGTLQPGNSRKCSRMKSGPASDRCASRADTSMLPKQRNRRKP